MGGIQITVILSAIIMGLDKNLNLIKTLPIYTLLVMLTLRAGE